MSADLYYHPVSVPARAALLVVRNLELNVNVNILNIYTGEQNTPEYLKINPLHQVPCYVEKDFILTESKAIACYLANANPSKLYPADLKKRALVDSRLYFDATNCFPTIRDFAVSFIYQESLSSFQISRFSVLSFELALKKLHQNDEQPLLCY